MIIKRHISFVLRPYGRAKKAFQIQIHVTFNGQRVRFSTGGQLLDSSYWNSESQKVLPGYHGSKGETTVSLNNILLSHREAMEYTFKYFEINEISPSLIDVEHKYLERLKGSTPKIEEERKHIAWKNKVGFFQVFDMFVDSCGVKNAWTVATYEKMKALRDDLSIFTRNVTFSYLDEAGLTEFVNYLRDRKHLRTPRRKKSERIEGDTEYTIGLRNSTIAKKLEYLRWFLNWATVKGYNENLAYKAFRPTLKKTQKKVIYISKAELEQLRQLKIPKNMSHLEAVRDVFLFCCFSGLRHSDVLNLRRSDIGQDHIEVTTVKTADSLSIELNAVTRRILEKYADVGFPENRALPVQSNQAMNRDLKILCRLAGINTKIRITTYKGSQRHDEVKEKWQLVGTHTGRRTFIVHCLSLGIAPNVVMKWTGHSNYKAMTPYIDIVDAVKASEMNKLNTLI